MKIWFCTKAWLLALVVLFFIGNLAFWSYHPRNVEHQTHESSSFNPNGPKTGPVVNKPPPPPPPAHHQPPPPPPPPPQQQQQNNDLISKAAQEAQLYDYPYPPMTDSPKQPKTYIPDTHTDLGLDLDTVAPTSDKTTLRLNDQKNIGFSTGLQTWQLGVINTKPDVFITSDNNFHNIQGHYAREHRIYTLMKWILRIHRRDPERKTPLMMVDAGT
ncbi:hypothetical protein BJ944DRAFT_232962 [Cunninghamella echinulata]|nr:hypothetical protein BJ944DRAFT_232962 [Cunninghamella echinulata]